jgi:hypothetical protein
MALTLTRQKNRHTGHAKRSQTNENTVMAFNNFGRLDARTRYITRTDYFK